MAYARSRRMPIAIFEDEQHDGFPQNHDVSSEEEDGLSDHETDEHGRCDPGVFVDNQEERIPHGQESEDDDYEHGSDADVEDTVLSPNLSNIPDPFFTRAPPHSSDPVKSIETAPTHAPHNSFTTTSRIHIDDTVDPHLDYRSPLETSTPDENGATGFLDAAVVKHAAYPHEDNRKVSESVSTLPDEIEYYRGPIPGRAPLGTQGRPHRTTPSRTWLYGNQHSRSNSTIRHDSPYLHSPSSVRALHPSSPPPLASPLFKRSSPRLIRSNSPFVTHSRDGTPTRRTRPKTEPPQQPPRNHEFPLLLLHCTLYLYHTPAGHSVEALEACGASERVLRDSALLKQKMDPTIMERGVLVQHPGEDYEVLEERVLESLELRRPKIGTCGHFNQYGDHPDADNNAEGEETHPQCADCAGHLSHHLLSDFDQQEHRRWEVKVWARNGLMKSGAWSAAWRQMEKIDVEVGVWLGPEDHGLGERLEEWERDAARKEEEGLMARVARESLDGASSTRQAPYVSEVPMRSPSPRSTAPVERPATARSNASRHKTPLDKTLVETNDATNMVNVEETVSDEPDMSTPTPSNGSTFSQTSKETPITTLLTNYITRLASKHRSLIPAALILILAVYLACTSFFATKSGETFISRASTLSSSSDIPPSIMAATTTVTETASRATETVMQTVTSLPEGATEECQKDECDCDVDGLLEAKGLFGVEKDEWEAYERWRKEADHGEEAADEGGSGVERAEEADNEVNAADAAAEDQKMEDAAEALMD